MPAADQPTVAESEPVTTEQPSLAQPVGTEPEPEPEPEPIGMNEKTAAEAVEHGAVEERSAAQPAGTQPEPVAIDQPSAAQPEPVAVDEPGAVEEPRPAMTGASLEEQPVMPEPSLVPESKGDSGTEANKNTATTEPMAEPALGPRNHAEPDAAAHGSALETAAGSPNQPAKANFPPGSVESRAAELDTERDSNNER